MKCKKKINFSAYLAFKQQGVAVPRVYCNLSVAEIKYFPRWKSRMKIWRR